MIYIEYEMVFVCIFKNLLKNQILWIHIQFTALSNLQPYNFAKIQNVIKFIAKMYVNNRLYTIKDGRMHMFFNCSSRYKLLKQVVQIT